MAQQARIVSLIFLILSFIPNITFSQCGSKPCGGCGSPCAQNDDCFPALTCVNGGRCGLNSECGDLFPPPPSPPPPPPAPPPPVCVPSGSIKCNLFFVYPLFNCSPPVTSTTQATLTYNHLSGPSSLFGGSCDGIRHTEVELIVSMSTGWFVSGHLCGRKVSITAISGRSTVVARVVSQCNSVSGCRGLLGLRPPCGNNVIEGTRAVYLALGLHPFFSDQSVHWTTV